jgi:hypothetical protein
VSDGRGGGGLWVGAVANGVPRLVSRSYLTLHNSTYSLKVKQGKPDKLWAFVILNSFL